MNAPIYDITPFSMLDFPGHLACIVWFSGCSLRCGYCHNPHIIKHPAGKLRPSDLFDFISRRRNLLEAVVLSGGEATGFSDITKLCDTIKNKHSLKIKLDTNGTNPAVVKNLIRHHLIDYIALDYKAPPAKYREVCGTDSFNSFAETLRIINNSDVCFEVRTTFGHSMLNIDDIREIIDDLESINYTGTYYLQKFTDSGNLLRKIESAPEVWRLTQELKAAFPIKRRA